MEAMEIMMQIKTRSNVIAAFAMESSQKVVIRPCLMHAEQGRGL
jgi:hypothetical protein